MAWKSPPAPLSRRGAPRTWLSALGCALALAWTGAQADWAGFARYGEVAEIAVEAGEIRMNLRLAESVAPKGPPPAGPADPPPWLAAKLPALLGQDGKPLAGRLLFLRKGGDGGQAYYEAGLGYPLASPPAALAVAPPPDGEAVGLVVLHRGVPLADLAPLQKPLALALDWADPWRSRFDDPALVRRHAEPRSYVYVEPYEVRHEILLRLKDLRPWLDLGLKDPRYVEDGEREALKRRLGAFLLGRNPLLIDGAAASPQLDRVEFVRFNRAGVLPVAEPGRLDADAVLVGAALAYLTESPAQTVALRWDLFGAGAGPRQVSLIQGQETFDGYMTPKQPEYAWSQEEALAPAAQDGEAPPVLAAGVQDSVAGRAALLVSFVLALLLALLASTLLRRHRLSAGLGLLLVAAAGLAFPPRPAAQAEGGGAGLDDAQAKALLQALLHNAYRAFQLRDEEKVYDRLAKSLDGDLLDEIYLQQRRAVLQQAQGLGGEGKVDRVEILESKARRLAGGWEVSAAWMAHGSVAHWGHSHERHNRYEARLSLRPAADGQWKIVKLDFTGGQRLVPGAAS